MDRLAVEMVIGRCTSTVYAPLLSLSTALICAILLCSLLGTSAIAQTQRVVRYEYDAAGNIIAIRAVRNLGPPTVSALSPPFVNRGSSVAVVASGSNLGFTQVSTVANGLTISSITPVDETTVRFVVNAASDAAIGAAAIHFTTGLGTTSASLAIVTRLPVIATVPNPIALAADGVARAVLLTFDAPFGIAQTYDLAIKDGGIASVAQGQATLPAGASQLALSMAGHASGTTSLLVTQLASFFAIRLPVIVDTTSPPPGQQHLAARPVGVRVSLPPVSPPANQLATAGAGVAVRASLSPVAAPGTQLALAQRPVGALFDVSVTDVSPAVVSPGGVVDLIVSGASLDEVTAVRFDGSGLTVSGTLSVSPDGRSLTVPVTIAAGLTDGVHLIELITPGGVLRFANALVRVQN